MKFQGSLSKNKSVHTVSSWLLRYPPKTFVLILETTEISKILHFDLLFG